MNNLLPFLLGSIALLWIGQAIYRLWREWTYSLQGKTILLTGGSRGLGLVMARQLTQAGARLAICARDRDELLRATTELEQQGGEVLAIPCDLGDRLQVEQAIQQARDRFGKIDILINNAGAIQVGPIEEMNLEDYQEAMNIHFWAPLYTTLAVLPEMRQRQAGRIVNISSIGGKVSVPHLSPYCASKFALTGLSEGMRAELAKDGVKVTTVCPGLLRTGSQHNALFKGQHRQEYAWFSISDSLPFVSLSAERAARQIIAALRRGDAEIILSLPAQVATRFHGLFPGITANLLSWVNRLLPAPGGIGTNRALGKDSHSAWSPSWLTVLSDRAAQQNNQFAQEAEGDRAEMVAPDRKSVV